MNTLAADFATNCMSRQELTRGYGSNTIYIGVIAQCEGKP